MAHKQLLLANLVTFGAIFLLIGSSLAEIIFEERFEGMLSFFNIVCCFWNHAKNLEFELKSSCRFFEVCIT